jgi:hypothetical protein
MIREKFEPVLISPYGLHLSPELCREAWDHVHEEEKILRGEIAKADEWLPLCQPTVHINTRVGTSYHLKHIVERWFRQKYGGNGYVRNGCFLMAAHLLEFKMKGMRARYCGWRGGVWDCHNAFINIATRMPKATRAMNTTERGRHPAQQEELKR